MNSNVDFYGTIADTYFEKWKSKDSNPSNNFMMRQNSKNNRNLSHNNVESRKRSYKAMQEEAVGYRPSNNRNGRNRAA
jgi:hypothetical protein